MVAGTTSDYVDIICDRFPGRAVFITDVRERAAAPEPIPDATTEVLCDLTKPDHVLSRVRQHLRRWQIRASGVACFDCESLALAALIASSLSLPFAPLEVVAACRSKFVSKRLWRKASLPCPNATAVKNVSDALGFVDSTGAPVVVKPLTGSGSELTFLCNDRDECARALQVIESQLAMHPNTRMYSSCDGEFRGGEPERTFVLEEFIEGPEYSCDFVVDGDRLDVIRLAKKIPAVGQSFGTTLAYLVPAELPSPLAMDSFRSQLREAASAVGLHRALCMLDFIVCDGVASMLEIAPRPGGDCLPPLLLQSSGFDILSCTLDFAEGRPISLPRPDGWRRLVGLRLFADRPGVIRAIDANALRKDPRVLECSLTRQPGHRVVLPPEDYDSRLLGHAIFEPTATASVEDQSSDLAAMLDLDMETP